MPGAKTTKGGRDEIVAIDVGTRMTKAVCLRRKGSEIVLVDYVLVPTPLSEKGLSVEGLSTLMRQAIKGLKTTGRKVVLVLGAQSGVLTHVDLPQTSPADLRRMIKLSPKTYLQQDLPDHLFDCFVRRQPKAGDTTTMTRRRSKVLVGAVRRRLVEEAHDAARLAGLQLQEVTLAPVALANAFRLVRDDSHPDPAVLLDIGAASSIIAIAHSGDLNLSRSVALGADKFADVLSPAGGKAPGFQSDDEMSPELIQSQLQKAILTFAREVDASAGFYSSQHEAHISQLFVSGGTARSQLVIQMLESELSFSCEAWNLLRHLTPDMPEQRVRELEYEIPQLTVAIGAAVGVLREDAIRINLLAEEQEALEARRRDPVRRGMYIAAAITCLMLGWAGALGFKAWQINRETKSVRKAIEVAGQGPRASLTNTFKAKALEGRVNDLTSYMADRFLHGSLLNSLHRDLPPDLTLVRIQSERVLREESVRATKPGAPPTVAIHDHYRLTYQASAPDENAVTNGAARFRTNLLRDPYLSGILSPTNTFKLQSWSEPGAQEVAGFIEQVRFRERRDPRAPQLPTTKR